MFNAAASLHVNLPHKQFLALECCQCHKQAQTPWNTFSHFEFLFFTPLQSDVSLFSPVPPTITHQPVVSVCLICPIPWQSNINIWIEDNAFTQQVEWRGWGWCCLHNDSWRTLHYHRVAIYWHQLPRPGVQHWQDDWEWPGDHWVGECHILWCQQMEFSAPHHTCTSQPDLWPRTSRDSHHWWRDQTTGHSYIPAEEWIPDILLCLHSAEGWVCRLLPS